MKKARCISIIFRGRVINLCSLIIIKGYNVLCILNRKFQTFTSWSFYKVILIDSSFVIVACIIYKLCQFDHLLLLHQKLN